MSDVQGPSARVRFRQPVRVVPLEPGSRVLEARALNLSREGMLIESERPVHPGAKVAVSLGALGRTLPLSEAEVVRVEPRGFAVRFDRFLHPRGGELVAYLVENLGRGRPLRMAPRRRWRRSILAGSLAAAVGGASLFAGAGWYARSATRRPAVEALESPGAAEAVAEAPAGELGFGRRSDDPVEVAHHRLGPPAPGETRGEVALPTGAAEALEWAMADGELRLSVAVRTGQLKRTFLLGDPPRLVFDVEGAAPAKSYQFAGAGPFLRRVRVGRQAQATRVVVDLEVPPAEATEDGEAMILSFSLR